MDTSSSSSSSSLEPNFHDFLNRMRHPASADLVRSIKSFIVSISFHTTDAESDSRKLQNFLMTMEANIREHPLWVHCTDEEIDSAVEGLEKFVMTKLFNRTFASSLEDAKSDLEISEKICLLQHFIKPDHLDVPKVLQNEASLLIESENVNWKKNLQEIDVKVLDRYLKYARQRCKIAFLIVACDIFSKENGGSLLSTEGAMVFSMRNIRQVISSDSFQKFAAKELQKINAFKAPREKLLCIMNCCRVINNLLLNVSLSTNHIPAGADDFLPILIYVTIKANPPQLHSNLKFIQLFRWHSKLVSEVEYYLTNLISAKSFIANIDASSLSMEESEFKKNMQAAGLAMKGMVSEPSSMLGSSEDIVPTVRRHGKEIHLEGNNYPFMDKEAESLTAKDVQKLLGLYKQVVTRYTMLSTALSQLNMDEDQLLYPFKKKSSSRCLRIAQSEHPKSLED